MEPMSFRTKEDFVIKVGPEEIVVTVPRLKLKDAEEILTGLLDASRQIGAFSMRLASAIADAPRHNEEQRAGVMSIVETMLPALMGASCFGIVRETLVKISGGIITVEMVAEMGYDEAVKVLTYLIDSNFESLKNLYASLQTITTRR